MIVGTAGHIDHGKTALVKALTGVDADRLAEEKARGITIDLGFAYADLGAPDHPSGQITGFVDVPGHERLVHTMLAGAGGIDFALVVVAADDGVMPQTREHLAILDLLGVTRGVFALTKADLADEARRTAVLQEIRTAAAGGGLAQAPVLPVSVVTGEGIAALKALLIAEEAALPARSDAADTPFRLSVDRSFTLSGAGTVVTGMVLSGRVAVGDSVTISPSGRLARVRAIHAQNQKVQEGVAGQRCALNLAGDGITKEAIARGDMVLAPMLHAPADRIDAVLTVLGTEPKPLGTWFPARLHSHAAEVGARIVPLADPIAPGESGPVQLVLDRPIAAISGDRFVLRDVSASRTIGGGRFLDLRAPARKRRGPARMALLDAFALDDPTEVLSGLLAQGPVDPESFGRDLGLGPDALARAMARAGAQRLGPLVLSQPGLLALQASLAQKLLEFHETNPDLPGIGRERLRLALSPRLPKEAFLALLKDEAARGRIALDGSFVHCPDHVVTLSAADSALLERIWPGLLGEGRFRPPRVRDFSKSLGVDEQEVRRVMKLSKRLGRADEIAHDHFFAREVTAEMAAILRAISAQSPDGWFTAPTFSDRVQNGRKVAFEILDFFDRAGVTLRRGDLRRINPHCADLFG